MRGENNFQHHNTIQDGGTPPHAWGESCGGREDIRHGWYTPTCVGRIEFFHFNFCILAVHPHMRGENFLPPLMFQQTTWYTPTCVGRIDDPIQLNLREAVHPHMRGENSDSPEAPDHAPGTPPHAWGELLKVYI